jgi:hypothetical protein
MITAVPKTVYAKSAGLRNAATDAHFGATARPNVQEPASGAIEQSCGDAASGFFD